LLVEEALARLPSVQPISIVTPTGSTYVGQKSCANLMNDVCAISILRSGDILAQALQKIVAMPIGKMLIQRDESDAEKRPRMYWKKVVADLSKHEVLLLDPMLGTGGTALMCINELVSHHAADPSKIVFACCIASPEGINAVHSAFPQLLIVTAAVDEYLNDDKYIVPGLGDAGDRYFGVA